MEIGDIMKTKINIDEIIGDIMKTKINKDEIKCKYCGKKYDYNFRLVRVGWLCKTCLILRY